MPNKSPSAQPTPRKGIAPALGLTLCAALLLGTGAVVVYRYFPELIGADRTAAASQQDNTDGKATRDRRTNSPQIDRIDDEFDLAGLTLDRDKIISPNPDKDDIPSLTTAAARGEDYQPPDHPHWGNNQPPTIAPVAEANQISDDSKVIGVSVNGESRCYPHTVLDRHECINDVLGGVPIAITYCPLCDSATIFDRRMGQGDEQVTLEFGVSGLLYNSNVLLYDRTHHALWSQVLLKAVSGPFVDQPLRYLDGWEITTFGQWKEDHPDATALTYQTGMRRYRRQGYLGRGYAQYFQNDTLMFPVVETDDRLPNKTPVIGVAYGDTERCYLVSAIDGQWTDAFDDGATVVLRGDGEGGVAVVSIPQGAQVTHTFWYAWYAFHPDTQLLTEMPGE